MDERIMDRRRRRERGAALPLLLLLLVLLVGAGAWNYHRNWQAEQSEPRPYAGYDDAELAALIEAYESESRTLAARAESLPRARAEAGEGALLGERVAAFEQARRAGEAKRRMMRDARGHEAVLESLRREQTLRAERGAGLAAHWRRLTSF